MVLLRQGPARYFELREAIDGVSEKMLSQTLRALVRDGIVARRATSSIPPRVTYELTELGRGVAGPLGDLLAWLSEHQDELVAAQRAHDELESSASSVA